MSIPSGAFLPPGTGPGGPGRIRRAANLGLFGLSLAGGLAGLGFLWFHLATRPLTDVQAYYDAASRLNAGEPLYPPGDDPDVPEFYRYPPLLAVVLRPVAAVLPYGWFAALWATVVIAALVGTLRRVGLDRRAWLALGLLGIPLGWSLAIGQAQILVMFLLVVGTPFSIALAAHLKVFPILAALYWIGRGEVGYVAGFLGWLVGLSVLQAFLEPAGWNGFWDMATFAQVGTVQNLSPFALSPTLWLVLLAAGIVATLVLARTRFGWAAAVALATLAPPRLHIYMWSSLLSVLRAPKPDSPDAPSPPDAAEIYVASAR